MKTKMEAIDAKLKLGQPLTAMEKILLRRRQSRSDAMVRRHAERGNTSVRPPNPVQQ